MFLAQTHRAEHLVGIAHHTPRGLGHREMQGDTSEAASVSRPSIMRPKVE